MTPSHASPSKRLLVGTRSPVVITNAPIHATFHHLPNHLLMHIFALGMEHHGTPADLDEKSFPFTLLKVCKKWKSVALRTHWLWNNVSVPKYTTEAKGAMACKFMLTWISLSGTVPLDIVHCQAAREASLVKEKKAAVYAGRMLRISLAHEHHLHSLSLVVDNFMLADLHPYLKRTTGNVMGSGIHNLQIELDESVSSAPPHQLTDLLNWMSSLPELREVTLDDMSSALDLSKVPLERLRTSVTLRRWKMLSKEVLEIIRRSISSTALVLQVYAAEDETDKLDPDTHYTMPNLTKLSLSSGYEGFDILTHLILPNLRELDIAGLTHIPDRCERLTQFLWRSKCSLKSLNICDVTLPPSICLDLYMLPSLQSVEEVTFTGIGNNDDFLLTMRALLHKVAAVNNTALEKCRLGVSTVFVGAPSFVVWGTYYDPEKDKKNDYPRHFWFGKKMLNEYEKRNCLILYDPQNSGLQYSKLFYEIFGEAGIRELGF
ncbi:hypothetical protein CPB84DRAFT_1784826 [Gymnopilus junonius]|uniref:F-box domain-containing protein n=1 Tax=Gymnopilus junonius TaxID=109634 RepID=A0A9P5NKA7_GYMJU|nr:hypothetical protein CPB84DRAFT_1784826 [Gymnopilus junonius]